MPLHREACITMNGVFEEDKVCPTADRLGGCVHTFMFQGEPIEETILEVCANLSAEYLPPE